MVLEGEHFTADVVTRVLGIDEGDAIRRMSRDLAGRHRYLENVRDISPGEVMDAARAELHPDRAVVLIVGDPAQFTGSLEGFGEVTVIEVE